MARLASAWLLSAILPGLLIAGEPARDGRRAGVGDARSGDVREVSSGVAGPAPEADEPHEPDLRVLLDRAVEHGLPGISLVIDRPGRELRVGAAGHASLAAGEALTPDHAIHWASVTKQVTAAAVLRLADAGGLSLDRPILELLDEPEVAALPRATEVRVRQLLDHSSGFYATNNDPEYVAAWLGPEAGAHVRWGPRDFLRLAAKGEPLGRPGEGHFYSDTNYILLGMIVERVTGTPLPRHVAETIFEPLGMSSTYYLSELVPGQAPPVPTARGYLRLSEVVRQIVDVERFPRVADDLLDSTAAGERLDGAAGIVGTARDLHRFARAYLVGDLLSPASRGLVLAVADGLESEPPGSERQRIATAYRSESGVLITAEGDGPGGSHSLVALHPESGTLVVALTNHFGFFDEAEVLRGIAEAAVGGTDLGSGDGVTQGTEPSGARSHPPGTR